MAEPGFGITSYRGANTDYPEAVGTLQAANLSLNQTLEVVGADRTLGVNSARYEFFSEAAGNIDSATDMVFLGPINRTKKSEIITLGNADAAENNMRYYASGAAAFSALETLYGAPSSNEGVISDRQLLTNITYTGVGNTRGFSVSAGTAVTQLDSGAAGIVVFDASAAIGVAGSILVQDVTGSFLSGAGYTVIIGGSTDIGANDGLDYAASGEVYDDTIILTLYPKLYPADTGQTNPLADPEFRILTPAREGTGFAQTYYQNSIQGTFGSFPYCDDTFTLRDDVYTIGSPSGSISSITSIRPEIGVLRGTSPTTGIQSYVGAGATVKGYLYNYAVNIFSLEKSRTNTQRDINNNQAAIDILQNPAFGKTST
jgi:hypothetical protein